MCSSIVFVSFVYMLSLVFLSGVFRELEAGPFNPGVPVAGPFNPGVPVAGPFNPGVPVAGTFNPGVPVHQNDNLTELYKPLNAIPNCHCNNCCLT